MDEFKVQCRNLGSLRAIRLESDCKSSKPNWHLDYVVIQARVLPPPLLSACLPSLPATAGLTLALVTASGHRHHAVSWTSARTL